MTRSTPFMHGRQIRKIIAFFQNALDRLIMAMVLMFAEKKITCQKTLRLTSTQLTSYFCDAEIVNYAKYRKDVMYRIHVVSNNIIHAVDVIFLLRRNCQ